MKSQKNSGYTLITTMLIMIILFVIGAAGAMLVYYGNLTSGAMTNYQKAYYNADYGLQQAVYNAMNGSCSGIPQTTLSTGGTVEVITQVDSSNNTCFIESIGTGQTGGQVVKAVAVPIDQIWAALYIGAGLPPLGSINVNGCDPTCPGPGVMLGSILSSPISGSYCSSNLPSNSQGVYGNPPWRSTSIIGALFNDMSTLLNGIANNISNLANNNPSCSCSGNATASNGTITCSPLLPPLSPSYSLPSDCQAYYIKGLLNIAGSNDFTGKQIYASAITIGDNNNNGNGNSSGNGNSGGNGNVVIKGGLLDAYGSLLDVYHGLSMDVDGNSQIGTPDDPTAIISQGVNFNFGANTNNTLSIYGLLLLNNSFSVLTNSTINMNINGAMYVNAGIPIVIGDNYSINLNTGIIRQLLQEYPVLGLKPPRCLPHLFNAVTLY